MTDDGLAGFVSPGAWLGRPFVHRYETASTHDDLRAMAQAGAPHGAMVVADQQTAGRGRLGRAWLSAAGENLAVSVLLRPEAELSVVATLPLVTGLAVADAVDAALGAPRARVKWPNDVRVDGRKVAGVLVEGALRGDALAWLLVGIGVNVRGDDAPEAVRDLATTLRRVAGRDLSRVTVLDALVRALEARYEALFARGFGAARGELRARCDTLGARVTVGDVTGVADDIADDGALVVLTDDGRRVDVRVGDVR